MKKLYTLLGIVGLIIFSTTSIAQCPNTNGQFGTSTAPTPTDNNLTLTTCIYGGEYRLMTNMVAGSIYTFETCGDTGFDTQMTIFNNTSGAVVGYNDDFCGLQSSVTFTSDGSDVRVSINQFNCQSNSTCMTLIASVAAPANDPCNTIVNIAACGDVSNYSLSGNGVFNGNGPFGTPGAEQLYSFTATVTGSHIIDVTNSGGYVDLFVKDASAGCSGTGWTYIDDVLTTATNAVNLTAGTTYYFMIDDENTTSSTGTLEITCPSNIDPCNQIVDLNGCGAIGNFSLMGAGAFNGNGPWNTPGGEQIFSYTAPLTGDYEIEVSHSGGGYIDLFSRDAASGCSGTGWTYEDDILGTATVTINLVAGTTYYFLLDDENTTTSPGSITINCPCIPSSLPDGAFTYNGPFTISGSTSDECDDCSLRPSDDQIYSVEILCAGDYTFETCGGASFDTYLYLTDAFCGNVIAFNDDACGLQSSITATLAPGTYFISIEAFSALSSGDFDLFVSGTEDIIDVEIASSTNVSCFGGSDGSATAEVLNGTAPFNFMWSDSQTTATASGLSAGTYTVTGTDANGCAADSALVTISEPTLLVASATSTEILCNGGTTDITVAATGGTPPYSGIGIYTEVAGTHMYTVTDANGCTADVTITVTEPTQLELDLGGCSVVYGGLGWAYACATIDGTASNGTPGYTYSWSTGESTPSITVCPDSTTTYSLTATDANGCSVTETWTVTVVDIICSDNGSSSSSGSGSSSGSSSSSASAPSLTSGPSCPSSASSGSSSGSSSNSGSGSGSSNDSNSSASGSSSGSSSGSGSGSGSSSNSSGSSSSSSCSLPSDGNSSCGGSSSNSNSGSSANKKLKVLMCFNGMTYCVKYKHIDKKLACGYTLGPCDAQQEAACDNSAPADTVVGASCVCSGRLTSVSVRYIGPSNGTVDASAKSCGVPISSTSGLNTGDIFYVNAADGGLQYLRNTTYLSVAGSSNGTVAIPTSCCNNPIGKTYFPFEIIGWVDTQGNECGVVSMNTQTTIGASGKGSELAVKKATIAQYPNPASTSATFEFTVPTSDEVSVSIVNIRGELIATIFSEEVEADRTYAVTQDISQLQSGIYFVHLNTADGIIKEKFIVLK